MPEYAAMVLAGGAARRMGGATKPLLAVRGVPLLHRVLDAVVQAHPVIVVGPRSLHTELADDVLLTREEPAGGGPVAAIAAGILHCGAARWVAVVAADLPFLTEAALLRLWEAAGGTAPDRDAGADVALYLDEEGRRQSMCTVWRTAALRAALPVHPSGYSMRDLLAVAEVAEVTWSGTGPAPWYDCDTPADLAQAEEAGS